MAPESVSSSDLLRLYHSLRRIRRIEEEVARVYPSDVIKSPVHLSIGQEAVSVGVIDVLDTSDVVAGSYRGHAAYLAKGGSLKGMLAEMYGKSTGCAGGKGGSMHLIGPGVNMLGASAVVGTHIPMAAGYALTLKRERRARPSAAGRVAVVFFGDGATEEGVFAETLNFAALHQLPLLLVCENNGYAIHTPLEKRWATRRLCERVESYGIPAQLVEDGDVLRIRTLAGRAVAAMRDGGGPQFLECHTYRWREHVGPGEDYEAGYRPRAQLQAWIDNDQVERLGGLIDGAARLRIDQEIEQEIAEAVAFAEASPFPEVKDLFTHVYAP